MKRTIIIMAGGSGERFWPLSRTKKPKQLLKLTDSGITMIEEAISRVENVVNPEDVFIITSETLLEPIREVLSFLPAQNIIAEPFKRNTAPCLALTAAFIRAKYEEKGINEDNISIGVLTADHIIKPKDKFEENVISAFEYVENNNSLATIGIRPDRPETGYGYINFSNQTNSANIFQVEKFVEKPNLDTAEKYLASGEYLWNSGMFFWRLDYFNSQLIKHLPEVGERVDKMYFLYKGNTDIEFTSSFEQTKDIYDNFPNISIDYGLMEKADSVVVVKSNFDWDDIGSLDSIDRTKSKDENGNIIDGLVVAINVKDSIIINACSNGKVFSLNSLDSVVAIMTDDAVMICPKSEAQRVKENVIELRNRGLLEYL